MSDRPRPVHYQVAHRYLPSQRHALATRFDDEHARLSAYFRIEVMWDRIAETTQSVAPRDGLDLLGTEDHGDLFLNTVKLPTPEHTTEAHFVLIAFRTEGQGRCFVMERGVPDPEPRAYVAEWRDDRRIRHGDLPEVSRAAFVAFVVAVMNEPPPADPPATNPRDVRFGMFSGYEYVAEDHALYWWIGPGTPLYRVRYALPDTVRSVLVAKHVHPPPVSWSVIALPDPNSVLDGLTEQAANRVSLLLQEGLDL